MFGLFRKTPAQQAEDDAKIQASLSKTRQGLFGRIGALFQANEITDDTWDELEELLIQADLGINTAQTVVAGLRKRVQTEKLKRVDDVRAALKDELVKLLAHPPLTSIEESRMLTVVLIVGVNGSGKTTSIAKLARYYKARGKRVVLAAADTYRAAAIDQLKILGRACGRRGDRGRRPELIPAQSSSMPFAPARRAVRQNCSSSTPQAVCTPSSI